MKNRMGMWIFLSSEILIFGVLLFLYQLDLNRHEAAFRASAHDLHFMHGTINTVILLTSSYFVALAESMKKKGFLIAAMVLGFIFIGVKGFEYYDLTQQGKFPLNFGPLAPESILFFVYYGFLTFLHLVHVFIGITLLGLAYLWHDKEEHMGENVGLYWHFVDLVWVFIYPLFYLIGH
jgi:cytochrome c oxidase subunit 3